MNLWKIVQRLPSPIWSRKAHSGMNPKEAKSAGSTRSSTSMSFPFGVKNGIKPAEEGVEVVGDPDSRFRSDLSFLATKGALKPID